MKKHWSSLTREQRIEAIKDGIAHGMSTRLIADQFEGCTRNAVIGLSYRAKVPLTNNPENNARGSSPRRRLPMRWKEMSSQRKADVIRQQVAKGKNSGDIADMTGTTEKAVRRCAERHQIKVPQRRRGGFVSILDIQSGQCRAPKWDDRPKKPMRPADEWLFCGRPIAPGSSYCPQCHERFWSPPKYQQPVSARQMYVGYGARRARG